MRSRLLISIIGILVVAVSIAGLLIELDSLKNPIDANNAIPLENGLSQIRVGGGGGSSSGLGLAVKGPVKLSQEPVLKVSGATGVSYLRVIAGETYTGTSWLPPQSDVSQTLAPGADVPVPSIRNSNNYSSTQVSVSPILPLGQGPIAISLYTNKPHGSNAFIFHPSYYGITTQDELTNGYFFQAMMPVLSPDELRNAKTIAVTPSLLQLPDTLPQRVKDLAADITRGQTNDYDKLEAIITYLHQYTYDLDNAPIPPGRDGVDFFLFDDKRGVCCTFSSAFVVLARSVGIPARVVGGWAIAPVGTEQVVKAFQAHQWAEVPFSGLGWVTFEATVGGPPSRTDIPLENGLLQSQSEGISSSGLAVKGPVHLPDNPVLKVSGATGVSYLRVIAGETYTGTSWLPPQSDVSQTLAPGADVPVPSIRNSNNYSSTQVSVNPILPLGQGPIAISLYTNKPHGSNAFIFHPSYYGITTQDELTNGYFFQAMMPVLSPDELRNAKTIAVTPSLLQLPDTLPQRVKDLAADITRGQTNDYDKLEAIITYLHQYTYDLDNAPIPPGRDGVDFFLFDDKRGVCCTFSSAFVVLARSVGIPARVVGGWAIAPVGTEQVVKAFQAHQWAEVPFSGLGWITFEATVGGPPSRATNENPAPESTITEITSVNPVVNKGKTFNVIGKVTSANGNPVDGLSVELFINPRKETTGGVSVGKGTVTNGTFSIMALIPDSSSLGDYQLLAHSIGNSDYKESWSDPQIKVVTDTALTLTIPQRAKVSDPVTLQGKLTAQDSSPIPGQGIEIFIDGISVTELKTDADGRFQWEHTFDQAGNFALEARFSGTEYQLSSSGKANIKILIPTIINMQVQNKASIKDSVVIKGALLRDKTLIPVGNQQIVLTIDGQPLGDKLTTNQDGMFSLEHKFSKAGNYQIEVNFAGDSDYWEANAGVKLELTALSVQRKPVWIFACIAVALVLIITDGFILIRRRKRRTLLTWRSDVEPAPIAEFVPIKEKPHGISLKIEFPQINRVFPDVWGIGDELEILCVLLDPNGNEMVAKSLEVTIGSEMLKTITDDSGTAKLRFTFKQKGESNIKARFSGETKGENIQSERNLRIVDYREEIVSLFKHLTKWLSDFGVNFEHEATPREIQRATLRSKEELPSESLEYSISYFEEADFSTHIIRRNTYESMYLAQKNVTQYERKKANN